MTKRVKKLKFLVILMLLGCIVGCSGDKEELAKLKEELARVQSELEDMEARHNAVSEDLRLQKAVRRQLEDQLSRLESSAQNVTVSAQQNVSEITNQYAEQIVVLQQEVEELNAIIDEQDEIIAEQEAAFAEFMNMLGQNSDSQNLNY